MFGLTGGEIAGIICILVIGLPFGTLGIIFIIEEIWKGFKTVMEWKDARAARRSTINTLEAAYAQPWPEEEEEACR